VSSGQTQWTPMGSVASPYTGAGHCVNDLCINSETLTAAGVPGVSQSTIRNFTLGSVRQPNPSV